MGKGVSFKDEQLIQALLTNRTIKEAAAEIGRSENQVYRRVKQPAFVEKYEAARRQLLHKTTAEIQVHLSTAVQTMVNVMNDDDSSPQVRLNAADCIMKNAMKLTEITDILQRLDRLERGE